MGQRWQRVAAAAGLLSPSGDPQPTIFAQMSALANATGAINLGQGFPDTDGPDEVKDLVKRAIDDGRNQYPPATGVPALREAIAEHQGRRYGLALDPATQVIVSAGATEAIAAAVIALVEPGDEVITFEPYYDSYPAVIAMASGVHVAVPLTLRPARADEPGTDGALRFAIDFAALERAATARSRVLLLNSPHNPTGMVLTPDELMRLADFAARHDLLVITDEVYEHLVFGAAKHLPIASLPGMFERTLTVSSAGKTMSFTGWKVGWVTGPADLVGAVQTVRQFTTFAGGAPFQPAIAWGLGRDEFPAALAASLEHRRDVLSAGLQEAGFSVIEPDGTYFIVADGAPLGFADGDELARSLPALAGVAAIPVSALCRPGDSDGPFRSLLRFTFVKDETTIDEAVNRLIAARLGGRRR
nr:aminotransferase class I/II-fold pyridoxal phosphate-dependent enzyme [Rarobacter faecitabidus]